MKRFISILIILTLCLIPVSINVMAEDSSVVLFVGNSKALVNGSEKTLDEPPKIVDGRTLVPVRFISEAFGAKVDWSAENSTVQITLGETKISIQINSKDMLINGQKKEIDVSAQIIGGRTFVPMRALSEALGKKVFWREEGLIVIGDVEMDKEKDKEKLDKLVGEFSDSKVEIMSGKWEMENGKYTAKSNMASLLFKDKIVGDFSVSAKYSGSDCDVIVCYENDKNHYYAFVSDTQSMSGLYKVGEEKETKIYEFTSWEGKSKTIEIIRKNNTVTIKVNGTQVCEYTGFLPITLGQIGLVSKDVGGTFSDVKIVNNKNFSADAIKDKIILQDDFNDLSNWIVEAEKKDTTEVKINNGKLEYIASAGLTVWNKQKLSGNYLIEYDVKALQEGGKYDRLSDLNTFWNAVDPEKPDDFFSGSEKRGAFSTYHHMKLYYVGYGGNANTTTRFRKYVGLRGEKLDGLRGDVMGEYTKQPYLLTPNMDYKVQILVRDGLVQYAINGEILYSYYDEKPYTEGYFGFRTVTSHMFIDNLKVYSVK